MIKLTYHPKENVPAVDPRQTFEDLWSSPAEEKVKEQRTADVARILYPAPERPDRPTSVYRKRYWYQGFNKQFRGFFRNTFFRASRAAIEFKNLTQLNLLQLSEVRPILYGEDRKLRLLHRAMLITPAIPGTCNLMEFLKTQDFQEKSRALQRRFFASLGRWTASLHKRGFRDNNFTGRNILVRPGKQSWCFSKIDSPKGKGGRLPVGQGQPYLKDLLMIRHDLQDLTSRQNLLRATMAYLGTGKVDPELRSLLRRLRRN